MDLFALQLSHFGWMEAIFATELSRIDADLVYA
jgi:hypothetical protein